MKKITFLLTLLITSIGFSQAPNDNATDPIARQSSDVISIFSGAYTDVASTNYNPNWGQSGFGDANTAFDPGTGNLVLAYTNFNYQGNAFGTIQNISDMEFLHVDIWVNGSFTPRVFAISSGVEIPHEIAIATPNTWVSVDIPVAGITGDLTIVKEFKFDGGGSGSDAIYVDNLYFWKSPADPLKDATLSDIKVDGNSIVGFSGGTTSYTYEYTIGTTTPGTVSATATNAGASTSITQATTVPGEATIEVTAANGTDKETYTVSFVATIPNAAPDATSGTGNADADVLSIFSDEGQFSNSYSTDFAFGEEFRTIVDLDAGDGVNNAVKLELDKGGWGAGNNTEVDLSSAGYTHFNFSYFMPSTTVAGSEGHLLQATLVSRTPGQGQGPDAVVNITGTPDAPNSYAALEFGKWVNLSIPLTAFSGFETHLLLFKFGTPSTAFSPLVYIDNVFFSKSAVTLSTKNNSIEGFTMYPNPAKNQLTVTAKENITKAEVYNILGSRVKSFSINSISKSLDISELNSGMYMIKFTSNGKIGTAKFIKQ